MEYINWGCVLLLALVSIGVFYLFTSISYHPNPHDGFYVFTNRNLLYFSLFMLFLFGMGIYFYSFKRFSCCSCEENCKIIALFYIFTFIGVIAISWYSFNYRIDQKGLIGLILILIGLIIFTLS